MVHDGMRALLAAGVPEPPAGMAGPPLAAIRRRAQRRRASLLAGSVAGLAVLAVGAGSVVYALNSGTPAAVPAMVAAGVDDRTLYLGVLPPGARQDCVAPPAVPVAQDAHRVVLAVPEPHPGGCRYTATLRLAAPLAGRPVYDRRTDARLPVLPERILPHPGYPAELAHLPGQRGLALDAPLPTWTVGYDAGRFPLSVWFSAVPAGTAPALPVVQRLTVHGHAMQVVSYPADSLGRRVTGYAVVWEDAGWQVRMDVGLRLTLVAKQAAVVQVAQTLVWP
jgi:hypothetical protein